MKLKVARRALSTKGALHKLRREGGIPAVLYAKGLATQSLALETTEIQKLLREIEPGTLSTLVLELQGLDQPVRVLVKEIQYDKTNYDVRHMDFIALLPEQKIQVMVPIELAGQADCVGVKAGGAIRLVTRKIPVECLPSKLPSRFTVNVSQMNIGDAIRVNAITFPEGVTPCVKPVDVIAVVGKR